MKKPVVLSTWDAGIAANKAAWNVLRSGGRALDAVEQGVRVTEDSLNCCVGLGANPDRDGFVTLDACIMDEFANCGSVDFSRKNQTSDIGCQTCDGENTTCNAGGRRCTTVCSIRRVSVGESGVV